jgi:hypothetical protein
MIFSLNTNSSANNDKNDTTKYIPIDVEQINVENKAFNIGEKLTFSIDYGPIQAGVATMSVVDTINFKNRKCYQVVSEASSSKSFSIIFKVEDRIESIIDSKGIFSWKIKKHLHEGNYDSDNYYEFDYKNNIAFSDKDTVKISQIFQDALSSLFYLRTQKLEIGKALNVPHFDNGKIYNLEIKVLKKEKIKVKTGIYETILVEPLMKSIGVFKHGGNIRVWVTNDERKMPVKMTTKIYLGSIGLGNIGANLIEHKGFD